MRWRSSLYTKILLWVLLNLVAIGVIFLVIFNLRYRFDPDRSLLFAQSNQFEVVSRMISEEMRDATPEQRQEILQRYSASWGVDFLLFTPRGGKLAGKEIALPEEVRRRLAGPPFPFGGPRRGQMDEAGRPPMPQSGEPGSLRRQRGFLIKTENPTQYWAGTRIPILDRENEEVIRGALLLAVSDSFTGNGLFFDPKPLVTMAAVVFLTSILLWLPFVRRLTGSIKRLTAATEQIADERFDVRLKENRRDELGRLGKAINHLAIRLDGFVHGQKRFLGDISHELNSPLARMQFALGILEERSDPALRGYVEDVKEEVVLMSQLVDELLAYARTGLKGVEIRLTQVPLRPVVEKVIAREAAARAVRLDIEEGLQVMAQPELLTRALANVVRNAVRYAGEAGEIAVQARREGETIRLCVIDQGPGIPEEMLSRVFDPFYRVEPDRARATGGAGLGLAIVKTCIEACGGTVSARNLHPGFEVIMVLKIN